MTSKIYSKVAAACFVCCGMTAALTSCNDFIDVDPQGVISEDLAMCQPDEAMTGTPIRFTSGPTAMCRQTMP